MLTERWHEIERLYHSACERTPEERPSYLESACAGDKVLQREVESLLANEGTAANFLETQSPELTGRAPESPIPAETKIGPYVVLEFLRAGGMGEVYKALDTRLERTVAIKFLPHTFAADRLALDRFQREARAASALNHPRICTVHDVGDYQGRPFLVMEFLEGQSLRDRMAGESLPITELLDFAVQISDALQAAHAKGVVHRDIKPGNIFITTGGQVKILDFGVAKRAVEPSIASPRSTPPGEGQTEVTETMLTQPGSVAGTLAYLSPEQARGEEVDVRTDIYSFGVVLYEMATGRRPFRRETAAELIEAILNEAPVRPRLVKSVTPDLERIVLRALERDRETRYQTIGEMLADLRSLQQAKPRWFRKAPLRLAFAETPALAAALPVLVLVVGFGAWFLRGPDASPDQILHAVPLTTYLGTQDWPSFSPDGSQVAFSWDGDKQDNFDIYVKKIGREPPLQLTRDPAVDGAPAWSPDGNTIAFLRNSLPGKAWLVLIPPTGSSERVLAQVAVLGPNNRFLSWSPDSKWLATFDRPATGAPGLWLLSANTGERRRLTTVPSGALGDIIPAFAPDGSTLAFTRLVANNSTDVYLLPLGKDLNPRGEPRLLIHQNAVLGLAWAPNGELILSSGPPGSESLFRLTPSGLVRRRRLTEQGQVLNLTVSARSNRLVFSQSRRELDIYRAELSGSGGDAHQPTPLIASSRLERYPRYSPDGKKIAFVSLRSGSWQLWVSDAEGKNPVQMTSFDNAEVAHPTWSADGHYIGFTSNADGAYKAYVLDAAGGHPKKIEALGKNVYGWTWSRDGRWILFSSASGGMRQLWKMPANGGPPEQMTQHGTGGGTCAESLDGKLLYYTRPGGVWSVPVDGGTERAVVQFDVDQGWIEATSKGIYFVANSSMTKPGDMMFYHFAGGAITKVGGVKTRYGFSVSPDERWLLYTTMTSTGADLMLAENFR